MKKTLPGLLLLLLFLFVTCTERKDTRRGELLRDLPPDMVDHLISGDDSTLARYGREAGIVVLLDAAKTLDGRMCDLFIENKQREALTLISYNKCIARLLASEYNYHLYHDRMIYFEGLAPDIRRARIQRESDYYSFRAEIHLPADEKLRRYAEFLEAFVSEGNLLFMALCEYEMSYACNALGDRRERVAYLKAACRHFAACGLHEMTCPALTELGGIYEQDGRIDSMIICYEEAERIAHRSRLPWESAQINSIYAKYYARHGRLSLAYDLLSAGMELCREYRGEYSELEFIIETMVFQADIGCWDVVERLLRRARVVQSKYEGRDNSYIKLYALRIDRIEARLLMARGDVDGAGRLYEKTEDAIRDLVMPYTQEPELARLFAHWAGGLLENGRLHEALVTIKKGSRCSGDANLPAFPARFALLEAKTAFELGDVRASGLALGRFERLARENEKELQRERIEGDALRAKLELEAGDRDGAVMAMEKGLMGLRRFVTGRDASVQSYLWIGECSDLRHVMHDVASGDPVLGYGAELFWRDFYRLLGGRVRTACASAHVLGLFRMRAEAARNRIGRLGAVHCIYLIRGDEIWRWTSSRAGIHRDILDASTGEVREYVTGAWKMMSGGTVEPATMPQSELQRQLRSLARVLLPAEMLDAPPSAAGEPFFVTTDGFLGLIPFEAFDIGNEKAYIPLLLYRDVAYLRFASESIARAEPAPGVILVSEKPSKALRKRYPFQPELDEAVAEGETVAELNPGAVFLAGASASKSNLLSVWEKAPFIYLAAHMLRDPQVPYLMLIPLASPVEPFSPDAAYLDISDIRSADFDACRTVILSGCSSGAPYLDAGIAGPSLGDAFLDSGAGAVVHTFWDVPDSEARRLMTAYVRTWDAPGASGIHALCDVRRRELQSSKRGGHPFGWAAYSIKVGRL